MEVNTHTPTPYMSVLNKPMCYIVLETRAAIKTCDWWMLISCQCLLPLDMHFLCHYNTWTFITKRAHLQLIYTCSFKHWPNEGTHFKVMTCADVNNHKCKTKTYKQYVCGVDCVTLLYDPCYINDYNWLKKYNTMINFRLYATRDWSTWIFLWFYL